MMNNKQSARRRRHFNIQPNNRLGSMQHKFEDKIKKASVYRWLFALLAIATNY
ncbi:hypothetical protein P3576_12090 [Vibrio parahaemolyticus]|uniref:hypothetical protein n=2 Tax=Vibrio parahaemolyticus TaxID=670 RepID=UPI0015DF396F|nr:hypothetical protein [Vibrio parahaemolyticus]EHH2532451.1 hypothetical protein [Vibrio parahaemolyticus]ELA8084512.1 hypothetical protein [Vibrio parahaemolyticus]ELA8203431.1 hypothetical protein [Vibrio parahaemolyticus]ELB2139654.1 hypothetical protein [Vibrio parahaemolyticus]ELB2217370.1 hypothetical protein [Vibrio parahaemolyticus]